MQLLYLISLHISPKSVLNKALLNCYHIVDYVKDSFFTAQRLQHPTYIDF
jgi:hypothetical protein